MRVYIRTSRSSAVARCRRGLLCAAVAATAVSATRAHDLFTQYVQHRVQVTAGARHIDVEIELTFFEEWSSRERRAMDTDGNKEIGREEVEAYVQRLAPDLSRRVTLRVGGTPVELTPLYNPEVDLLGTREAGPGHHRLTLFFFGPTPTPLKAGTEITLEDRLWVEAKALGSLRADGLDGCQLEAEQPRDPGFPPARPGEARVFKARWVSPPNQRPAATPAKP